VLFRNIKLKNFTKDWQEALCYLVEALNPGHIPENKITDDKLKNVTQGIEVATKMGVPQLIDASDMCDHPDSLANITYISFFREFQKDMKKKAAFEATIVGTECIAYGPGLLPGVSAGVITGFTVEARNGEGQKVKEGGAVFVVKITGPNADVQPKVSDGGDGTYIVEYTADDPGNHFIQVTYQSNQIKGSPFQVNASKEKEKPKPKTMPNPHWYYEEVHHEGILKQVSKWVAFDDSTSDEIEKCFRANMYGGGNILNGQSYVDFNKMVEKSNAKKGAKRSLTRGVWFFQDDDGTWAPYDAYCSQILETEYQTGSFAKVNVSEKPPRWVIAFADGSYKQFRQTKGGNPNGRPVQRGYKGQTTEIPTPST